MTKKSHTKTSPKVTAQATTATMSLQPAEYDQLLEDFKNAVLILSVFINLSFFVAWLVIQVS